MNISKINAEQWTKARFLRQSKALMGLAWPATLSRVGIAFLATVDTFMVGLYSTKELAFLNLGNSTIIMTVLVASIGLLIGTIVKTADAYGREDFEEAGRVWMRALPYALAIGVVILLICLPGEWLFKLGGLSDELAHEGGKVMMVLGLSLPGHVLYVHSVFFLEGIERPKIGMYMMVLANIFNVVLNYGLVYGTMGLPEMGAVGSAWATTIGRTFLAVAIILYILKAKSLAKYKISLNLKHQWNKWKHQRELGYAASISLTAEVSAFSFLIIVAGWLGTLELASFGIVMNVMTLGFMVAAGMGVAASVRVGIGKSRGDYADAGLAGWTSVFLGAVGMFIVAIILNLFNTEIAQLYSSDALVIPFVAPLFIFTGYVLLFDGEQAILANCLRGLGESWKPMGLQIFSYWFIMIPLSYYLAIPAGMGVVGLLWAVLIASIVSSISQGILFYWLTSKRQLSH